MPIGVTELVYSYGGQDILQRRRADLLGTREEGG